MPILDRWGQNFSTLMDPCLIVGRNIDLSSVNIIYACACTCACTATQTNTAFLPYSLAWNNLSKCKNLKTVSLRGNTMQNSALRCNNFELCFYIESEPNWAEVFLLKHAVRWLEPAPISVMCGDSLHQIRSLSCRLSSWISLKMYDKPATR